MQYFRFLPDPAKLRREAQWGGSFSIPRLGDRVQTTNQLGAGTVIAYFVDKDDLGVLVRLELYPDADGPDFHFLGHWLSAAFTMESAGLKTTQLKRNRGCYEHPRNQSK
jgi:hypothetical protein